MLLGLGMAGGASGQEPPLPAAPDTAQVATDTTEVAEAPPSPPPQLPGFEPLGEEAWESGIWEWDRGELLMLADLSITELLERIPGITPVRAGVAGQPEGAGVFGSAAGAIRYILDGFELDPLTTATYDPSRIPLLALRRVRVERRVTGAVVHLETLSPDDPRPHSIVEAATGDLGINLFRGMFLAPGVLGGPLAAGFERLATESGGSSNLTTGWLKWTFVRDSAGVQLEYRQTDVDRAGVGIGLSGSRRDWALRARGRLLGLTAEGYTGASTVEDDRGSLLLREGTPQAGVRVQRSFDGAIRGGARAGVRLRDHPRLPRLQASWDAWLHPRPWASVGHELVQGWWDEGEVTRQHTLSGRVGPFAGVSAFAEATIGAAPAVRVVAPLDSLALAPVRQGARAGLSLDRWGAHLGAAVVRTVADTAASFGVAFDPSAPAYPGGEATGVEAVIRLPTGWSPLRVEGWLVAMDAPDSWLYTPEESWRAALVYHALPLPSGNLEVYARIEHLFRGGMMAPCTPTLSCTDTDGDGRVPVGSYRATNLELTLRVVTVRAFVRWENAFHRTFQQDLPFGYPAGPGSRARASLPGQHILYGVKWEFWN